MKLIQRVAVAIVLAAASASFANATEYAKGFVKKVDAGSKKVTVIHEELKNLDMPAMTMVFRTADEAMLARLQEGQDIEFLAERVNGKLTITELK
jgi:Cu/Ag efflux protein CusF